MKEGRGHVWGCMSVTVPRRAGSDSYRVVARATLKSILFGW